jgi:fatty-acyl-CoA synthase
LTDLCKTTERSAAASPELSYASGVADTPLLGETIDANLRRTVAAYPHRDAVVDISTGRRLSYAELDSQIDALARGLLALGVSKGERVAVWAPNCIEWFLVQYATARIGAVLVNINPAYRTGEVKYVLAQSGAVALVSALRHRSTDHRSILTGLTEATSLRNVLYIGDSSWDHMLAVGQSITDNVMADRSAELSFDDPINIQYTSGTTGTPKGVTLTHHNILNNGFFVGKTMGIGPDDRICVPVPFYHCFGMVLGNIAATTHGACVVIPSPTFDARSTLRAIEVETCTAIYGVPTMFVSMLNAAGFADFELSSLRTGIMAGSPCPSELMKRVMSDMHATEITICYGMTETSPVCAQTHPDDALERRVSTVGRVHPHLEIKIIDPESKLLVSRGRTGELCTRGYSVMAGYWDDPTKTGEVLADGWMHTGDLAVMDADGYISIVGRLKDMVIRGGENIYPCEIEEFLYSHPDIVEAQVIGVPDSHYGEELMAWVRLRDNAEHLSLESLREFADGKIAKFKLPRYLQIVESFPMTASGKIRKIELRAAAIKLLRLS